MRRKAIIGLAVFIVALLIAISISMRRAGPDPIAELRAYHPAESVMWVDAGDGRYGAIHFCTFATRPAELQQEMARRHIREKPWGDPKWTVRLGPHRCANWYPNKFLLQVGDWNVSRLTYYLHFGSRLGFDSLSAVGG